MGNIEKEKNRNCENRDIMKLKRNYQNGENENAEELSEWRENDQKRRIIRPERK